MHVSVSSAKIILMVDSIRTISAKFNGEKITARTWPVANGHLVVLELTCCSVALCGILEAHMPVKLVILPVTGSNDLCSHHPNRHDHDFALSERLPVCSAERHAGNQRDVLKAGRHRDARGPERLVLHSALPRRLEQTMRLDLADRGVNTSMAMGKQ